MLLRTHVLLTHRQHDYLCGESDRTGLSISELVRRAIDTTYRQNTRWTVFGYEVSVGIWRSPDEAIVGRRPPGTTPTLRRGALRAPRRRRRSSRAWASGPS